MKRLRRWLLIELDLIGLLLLAGVVALWPLSYRRADIVAWLRDDQRSMALVNSGGQLLLAVAEQGVTRDQPPRFLHVRMSEGELADMATALPGVVDHYRWGFRRTDVKLIAAPNQPGAVWIIGLPHWLISGAATVLLLGRGRSTWLAISRRRRGLCRRCGYDLRHSPDRCPECGTPAR